MFSFVCLLFQLYSGELEAEFSHFQDWLQVFPLFKGRALGDALEEDDDGRVMGKFKVRLIRESL